MLERGYVRSMGQKLVEGTSGLLTEKDGLEARVIVIRNPPDFDGLNNYIFWGLKGNPAGTLGCITVPAYGRFEEWDFYTHTAPVAFVPRPGSLEAASNASAAGSLGLGGGSLGLGGGSLALGGKRKNNKTRKNKKSKKSRRRYKSN
jgi:hypothetical protein